ncbi:MAG: chromosomal replication initiator protein DnaA [Clostridia bacterium]|nr:chromosomal replication initiator protein DnaA [Clostridia bacterium]
MNTYYESENELNLNKIWQESLEEIAKKVSAISYDVWIKSLEVVDLKNNTLVLSTSSNSGKQTILKNYKDIIAASVNKVHKAIIDVEIIVSSDPEEEEDEQPVVQKTIKPVSKTVESSSFNPKYTFDTFVVGPSNQFVVAAAKSVAENPGASFNPLFIYGGVGLGKTHLLHAIGNYITDSNPKLKVVYAPIDKFTGELTEALRNSKNGIISEFKAKYSTADVLIMDDIQSMIGREATQNEFFNIFNELHEHGKQIVVASDRPVSELKQLAERITSRLAWGILADIGYPELETRIAILNKKAYLERYNVSREVINYIAESVTTNVREMEGMLTRVVFYAKMMGQSVVTMDTAREALKDIAVQNAETIDAGRIIDCVCKFYSIKKEELLGKRRTKEIALARQITMYLITELLSMPLEAVGQIFNKDHSTVIYAKRQIANECKTNRKLAVEINDMKQMLNGK